MLKYLVIAVATTMLLPAVAETAPPPADAAPLLDEARTAYGAGEYGHARRALEKAIVSVSAKHAEAIRAVLPKPFDGWTANDGDSTPVSLAALGGGLSITRYYAAADGTQVQIDILADSDLVEQMSGMYADASMIQMMGIKPETIGGETAFIDPTNGDVNFIFDKRTNIKVTGSAPADIRKSYAENIDFAAYRAIK